jgi:hypothetical protein
MKCTPTATHYKKEFLKEIEKKFSISFSLCSKSTFTLYIYLNLQEKFVEYGYEMKGLFFSKNIKTKYLIR